MEIVINIPEWLITGLADFGIFYVCLGSLLMLPWSIYRASGDRNHTYWHALTFKGCWLFIAVWMLWPRAVYGMYKGW